MSGSGESTASDTSGRASETDQNNRPVAVATGPMDVDEAGDRGKIALGGDQASFEVPLEAPRARPSSLAQTLFGSASERPSRPLTQTFPLPYLALAPSCVEDAFAGPSPDDVVLAAQAKGSLAGKATKLNPEKRTDHRVSREAKTSQRA